MGLLGEDMADVIDLKSKLRKHTEIKKEPTKRKIVRIDGDLKFSLFDPFEGTITIPRFPSNHRIYKHPTMLKVLMAILGDVSGGFLKITEYEKGKMSLAGVYPPGSILISEGKIMQAIGLTRNVLRRHLEHLEQLNIIKRTRLHRGTVITIVDWQSIYRARIHSRDIRDCPGCKYCKEFERFR